MTELLDTRVPSVSTENLYFLQTLGMSAVAFSAAKKSNFIECLYN